jgi:hypothetical protein
MAAIFLNTFRALGINDYIVCVGPDQEFYNLGAFQIFAQAQPYEVVTPLTGTSHQMLDQTTTVIINPAGTIATYTLQFPNNPYDGQQISITSTQTITSLTLSPGPGQTVVGAVTTMSASNLTHLTYIYSAALLTWFAI